MDHSIARRRVSKILGHVTCVDSELSPNPHLLPLLVLFWVPLTRAFCLNLMDIWLENSSILILKRRRRRRRRRRKKKRKQSLFNFLNCSGTLNFMGPRCDNTLLFARQGSASQACFMQQVSVKPNSILSNFPSESGDSSYQYSASYQYSGEPLFSRQTQARCTLPALKDEPFAKQDSTPTSTEAPKFARQYSEKREKSQLCCNRTSQVSLSKGMEWSPRIDVAESGADYVVTVELPGVSILDIRVEVDDQKLIVTGKRSTQKSGVANSSENSDLKYHRREIMQGPYRVFWPLPNNVNKDGVSAEFVNGFLRITLPKF